jgi:hypothetical protein
VDFLNLGVTVLGAALLVLSTGMLLIFTRPNKKRAPTSLREIEAITSLRRILGGAMEQGTRVHFGLGRAHPSDPNYASTLAGLDTLESITRSTLTADQTPVATSGDGTTSLLGEDTVRGVYRRDSTIDRVPGGNSLLAGVTPLAYAAGSQPVISSPDTGANLFLGHFGVESGLLIPDEPAVDKEFFGGSDSIPAQSVFYAASENTLLGEEAFALPAYLDEKRPYLASLMVQDLLRLIVVFGLLVGVILVLAGVL